MKHKRVAVKKPGKVMRLLRKLFPKPCDSGKERLRRYAGCRTLKEAWRLADSYDKREVLAVLGSKFRHYVCSCGSANCSASNAAAQPPVNPPAILVRRYREA